MLLWNLNILGYNFSHTCGLLGSDAEICLKNLLRYRGEYHSPPPHPEEVGEVEVRALVEVVEDGTRAVEELV